MAYDPTLAVLNPDGNRAEWELFLGHADMPGAGLIVHYVGEAVESAEYSISVESTEKASIAQRNPEVKNKDGGITVPMVFDLMKGQPAYDAIVASGLLGKVNETFEGLLLYSNIRVKQGGSVVKDAMFAQRAKVKVTISAMGGAGGETIKITSEIKTTGDIDRGYMSLGEAADLNFDEDDRTWKLSGFTKVNTFGLGDLFFGAEEAA